MQCPMNKIEFENFYYDLTAACTEYKRKEKAKESDSLSYLTENTQIYFKNKETVENLIIEFNDILASEDKLKKLHRGNLLQIYVGLRIFCFKAICFNHIQNKEEEFASVKESSQSKSREDLLKSIKKNFEVIRDKEYFTETVEVEPSKKKPQEKPAESAPNSILLQSIVTGTDQPNSPTKESPPNSLLPQLIVTGTDQPNSPTKESPTNSLLLQPVVTGTDQSQITTNENNNTSFEEGETQLQILVLEKSNSKKSEPVNMPDPDPNKKNNEKTDSERITSLESELKSIADSLKTLTQNSSKKNSEAEDVESKKDAETGKSSKNSKKKKRKKKKSKKKYESTSSSDSSSDSEDSSSSLEGDGLVRHKMMVSKSKKFHVWLIYSLSLNNNKLSKISSLTHGEIVNFILQYINDTMKKENSIASNRVKAYINFCLQVSSLTNLEQYTKASITTIVQSAINQIDTELKINKQISTAEIEAVFNNLIVRHGVKSVAKNNHQQGKMSHSNSYPSDIQQKKNKTCNKYNSGNSCNENYCSWLHNCSICFAKDGTKQKHRAKDCPHKAGSSRTSTAQKEN